MNKRGEWDPGTLLRITKYLVSFLLKGLMVFSNHLFCALFCVFHSKEGWQFASFEILIKQSADHVFRADLIEYRRNWFNWWAGWWCRLKFYSILSIEIQTYQPRAAHLAHLLTFGLNCSVCKFLISMLHWDGGRIIRWADPWWPILIHGDSYQVGFQVYPMRIFQDIPGCEW